LTDLKTKREKTREDEFPALLTLLIPEEKDTLKTHFGNLHFAEMKECFASGVQDLSETEKSCFEFMHSLNVDA